MSHVIHYKFNGDKTKFLDAIHELIRNYYCQAQGQVMSTSNITAQWKQDQKSINSIKSILGPDSGHVHQS